jgi:hypothetical protein
MKRSLTLAAAMLMCGTAAIAQTTTTTPTSDTSGNMGSSSTTGSDTGAAGAQGSMPTGTSGTTSTGTTATGTTSATGTGSADTSGTMSSSTGTAGASAQGTMDASGSMQSGTATASTGMAAGGTMSIAAFDADNNGSLTPLEFGQMVMASQAPAAGNATKTKVQRELRSKKSNNAATDVLNQTASAFSKADANRDMRVDATELSTWQSSGAQMM